MASGMTLADNYRRVLDRIRSACARSGREPESVTLVAVTKYAELEGVRGLVALGVRDLGEGTPQQLIERQPRIEEPVRWHLVGHLQRNKARKVLPAAACIHSVDSLRLLSRIESLAEELRLSPRVLLEVNVSGEARKHGFEPDGLVEAWGEIARLRHVKIAGLMTMAPYSEDPEQSRPVFRRLRRLRDSLAERAAGALPLTELSMGMSGDFEVAIEEGATLVRIGSALFENL